MSHTTSFDGFSFIHNGDFSGEIEIVDTTTGHRMLVPGRILIGFAAEIIRQREIARWENMEQDEILGVE